MGEIVRLRGDPDPPEELKSKWETWAARFETLWTRKDMPAHVRERIVSRVTGVDASDGVAREILEFLNQRRSEVLPGRQGYRPVEANLRFIQGRLASGITAEQLRAVVVVKCRAARAGEFDPRYLRPETLFNATKCEQYLGELGDGA